MKFQTLLVKTICKTPLGDLLLAASSQGLAGAWFAKDQKHLPDDVIIANWHEVKTSDAEKSVLDAARKQLGEYFNGKRTEFDLPFDLSAGTEFQQSVWHELLKIDCGSTITYGDICHAIGKPKAARAVGAAVGRNPVSIIVPCHRVIGSTGALTGYAGGLDRKMALLELEGALSAPRTLSLL